jgi:hypothetical protein
MFFFEGGFSCSLVVLYEALRISKYRVETFNQKKEKKAAVFFRQFWYPVIKTLESDPESLQMLDTDPYPDSMHLDPQDRQILSILLACFETENPAS